MKRTTPAKRKTLGHAALKERQRRERATHSDSVALRVHRAISWLGRAEAEHDDADAQFIFLWIAFNAAYAGSTDNPDMTEKRAFQRFLGTLLTLDTQGRCGHLVWQQFPSSIRLLLKNEYVFQDFWLHQAGKLTAAEWTERFRTSRRAAEKALADNDTLKVLSIVLGRLYTLRNQILHGGATWNGKVNRDQVRDCTSLLGQLVPAIIEIMLDHPAHDWGPAVYPVVKSASTTP